MTPGKFSWSQTVTPEKFFGTQTVNPNSRKFSRVPNSSGGIMNKIIDEFPELNLVDLTEELDNLENETKRVSSELLKAQGLMAKLNSALDSHDFATVHENQAALAALRSPAILTGLTRDLAQKVKQTSSKISARKKAYAHSLLIEYKDQLTDDARIHLHVLQALQILAGVRDGPETWWDGPSPGRELLQDTQAGWALSRQMMQLKVVDGRTPV